MNVTRYLADREEDSFRRCCQFSRILTGGVKCIFDVGANIGQSVSRYRECFPTCIMTSFEPNPESFSLLKRNWGDVPGITLNPVALSDFIGQASFYATRVSEGSSLLKPTDRIVELSSERKYDHAVIKVPTTTLDSYCQSNNVENIDILKLDVQGSELCVCVALKKCFERKKSL